MNTYSLKRKIAVLGYGLSLFCMFACRSYQELQVDTLKPAEFNLKDQARLVLVDRKIVHQRDHLSSKTLRDALGVTRDDLVNFFYIGLEDGLAWGEKKMTLERLYGMNKVVVDDEYVAPPLIMASILNSTHLTMPDYVLSVEYCRFYLPENGRVELSNNLVLCLYDPMSGEMLDSLVSNRLYAQTRRNPLDPHASVREYMYQKGWSYAERLVPVWVPSTRRIYENHRLLKTGHYFFIKDDLTRAKTFWEAALKLKPDTSVKAAVNLAWLHEREGDFDLALQLLLQAQKRLQEEGTKKNTDTTYLEDYIKILQQRIEDSDKLSEQIP